MSRNGGGVICGKHRRRGERHGYDGGRIVGSATGVSGVVSGVQALLRQPLAGRRLTVFVLLRFILRGRKGRLW